MCVRNLTIVVKQRKQEPPSVEERWCGWRKAGVDVGVLLREQGQAPFPSGCPNVLLFLALDCKAAACFLQI